MCSRLSSYTGKKLIEYGWDCPTPQFVRANIERMEETPFDGIVIRVPYKRETGKREKSIGRHAFSEVEFRSEEYEHAIEDLEATKFDHFTDNFIQVLTQPGVDWFSEQWSTCVHNTACLTRVAKLTGCKGIMLDIEDYSDFGLWNYSRLESKSKTGKSHEEYKVKLRQRGGELMQAINQEYPDLVVFAVIGPSIACVPPPEVEKWEMAPALFEGMCEAATPGTVIVDGYEQSYGLRTFAQFEHAQKIMKEHAKSFFTNQAAYEQHMSAGFGIWADNVGIWTDDLGTVAENQFGWHPDDHSKNYFTPEGLRASLGYARKLCDEYVWMYSEALRWWDFNVPESYIEALQV